MERSGEPWFVAADVCRALEIKNNRDALSRLDQDEKGVALIDTPGGKQELTIVNEAGLYSLVLGSRKPEAKAFKRWITHEVIPTIRKTGGYVNNTAKFVDCYFPQLRQDQKQSICLMLEESRRMGEKIEADAPKVLFSEAVSASKSSMLVGELAKVLKQNGIDIGQNRLFEWLRGNGFLIRRNGSDYNMPTQRAVEMGLFEIKETAVTHSDGHVTVSRTPKVTGKGSIYFVNRFLKNRQEGGKNDS